MNLPRERPRAPTVPYLTTTRSPWLADTSKLGGSGHVGYQSQQAILLVTTMLPSPTPYRATFGTSSVSGKNRKLAFNAWWVTRPLPVFGPTLMPL